MKKEMRSPGIEPGSLPWQGNILTVGQRTHRYCHEITMFRELKIFRSTLAIDLRRVLRGGFI